MAQGIVDSLFGAQPWQIQRAENNQLGQAADKYAGQAPFERAAGQLYRAGGMFGQAGMEGAGYVNPAMEEAKTREMVMGMGGDLTTAAGLKVKAMQFAQAGDQQTALKLVMLAKQQEVKEQEMMVASQKQALNERKQDFNETEAFDLRKREAEARIRQNDERIADARTSTAERIALQRESNQIKLMLGQAMMAMRQSQADAKGTKLTKGQEAVDRQFGKEYAEYQAGGGSADVEKQLKQLDSVAADLSKPGNDYTGPAVGLIPEKARAFTNQAAVDAKNKVEEVAQRNLRLVLGAQFTQVEGERLIARAYNPSLDPATNAARVKALSDQIRTAAKVKEDAARYFEENGTLTGWKGRMPTLSDFESAIDSVGPKQSASGKVSTGRSFKVLGKE